MKHFLSILLAALSAGSLLADPRIDPYDVVWTTPSKNSSQSMPVGGHSIGLNVWVEEGDLLFYAQRSGSFNENNEYHKLGRFRLRLTPNPFDKSDSFKQTLDLSSGAAKISASGNGHSVDIRVWVEAKRPVIHLDTKSEKPLQAEILYEGWRNDEKVLPNRGLGPRWGCFSYDQYPGEVIRYPDTVDFVGEAVLFYHRNRDEHLLYDLMIKQQGLTKVRDQFPNTQKGRTFGGWLSGDGFEVGTTGEGSYQGVDHRSWSLRSEKARITHNIRVYTHVDQTDTVEEWTRVLFDQIEEPIPDEEAWKTTTDWWKSFWQRSWIIIDPENPDSEEWELGRNYQVFRYQLGTNPYGEYPTKFNGGNFTYDSGLVMKQRHYDADWRPWGGGSFTAQNQRLVYWPMLKAGDFDLFDPQFEFYLRMVEAGISRVKTYWGHKGLLFSEQIENFGLPIACAWGWEPDSGATARIRSKDTEFGVLANPYINYHYESQLEFSYMILEYYRYTGKDISPYLEMIRESVAFFDAHYQMRQKKRAGQALDEKGKLVIYPSTACETYKGATNPADVISGLEACLHGLMALPEEWVSAKEKKAYADYLKRVPDYTYGTKDGHRIIQPAASWEAVKNTEIPQLYPLFPFDRFNLLDHDMKVFHDTWTHYIPSNRKSEASWKQGGIFLARMGEAEEAMTYQKRKIGDSHRRFPTFWGPGHDWVPDHNWGGSGMIAMQEMLMQCFGDRIVLLPAWPKETDVDFKLHAPHQTLVEVSYRDGKIKQLKVTPEERRKDVILPKE